MYISHRFSKNLLLHAEAEKARDSLNGRFFGGRMVKSDIYDQALYDHNDLSGWNGFFFCWFHSFLFNSINLLSVISIIFCFIHALCPDPTKFTTWPSRNRPVYRANIKTGWRGGPSMDVVVESIDNSNRVLNETLSHYYVLVDGSVVSLKNRRQIIRWYLSLYFCECYREDNGLYSRLPAKRKDAGFAQWTLKLIFRIQMDKYYTPRLLVFFLCY